MTSKFSLATYFLILVGFVGCSFRTPEQMEKVAATAFFEAGGAYERDSKTEKVTSLSFGWAGVALRTDTKREDRESLWRRVLPNVRYLIHLEELRVSGLGVTDDGLASIADLQELETLHLEEKEITDDGLKHLANLKSLETFSLSGTAIQGDGFVHLKSLPKLRKLDFIQPCKLTDKGMKGLAGLSQLEELYFDSSGTFIPSKAQGHGLRHLSGLPLKRLTIFSMPFQDENLVHIGRIHTLEYLQISGNKNITDDGIKHLAGLTNLKYLNISSCEKVTDVGIKHLAGLNVLEEFWAENTKVTSATWEFMGQVSPKIKVVRIRKF